jgi:DnaK suppressor protein
MIAVNFIVVRGIDWGESGFKRKSSVGVACQMTTFRLRYCVEPHIRRSSILCVLAWEPHLVHPAAPVKNMPSKKKTAKKAPAKKAAAKKAPAKKAAAKKAPAKKVTAKEAPAKAEPVKKAAAKKSPAPAPPVEEVKPVIVKPTGPIKLTAFAKKQQQKLLDLRDDLLEALYGVENDGIKAASTGSDNGSGQHQGDAGSDSYDRDLALSMLAKEKDALMEVEKALERIADGIYGLCERSGAKIPQERLEVLPFARLTMAEQQKLEDDKKTRGVHAGEYGFGAFSESSKSVSLDASDE